MKQHVKSITDLPTVLQDIEPWVKEPKTLYNGRKPGNFGLLPREIWANWLLCAIGNAQTENVDWTFSDDEDGILIPRWVNEGLIIKNRNEDGTSRYDFQYKNKRGYKTTIEGLSHKFNPEFWNYAKLISSTLRHGMPIDNVVNLVNSLQLDSESINTWKNGVARALKRFIADGTVAKKEKCTNCNSSNLIYQEGCLTCKDCGSSKCG